VNEVELNLGCEYRWYAEGRTRFLSSAFAETPQGEPVAPRKSAVFYNPFSKLSRDLTVIAVQSYFQTPVLVGEPLAGSGVRGIRLLAETDRVQHAFLNDINPTAVRVIRENARINNVSERVTISQLDGNIFLTQHSRHGNRFGYVDVDPVGAPVRFLESALRACDSGGMIGVSATDLAALTGRSAQACLRKYDALTFVSGFSKELAVRILVGSVARTAARLGLGVKPLLSFSHRHFVRIFVSTSKGKAAASETKQNVGWFFFCPECFTTLATEMSNPPSRTCPNCKRWGRLAGPLWTSETADRNLLARMLDASSNYTDAQNMLRKLLEEDTSMIGFYSVAELARGMRTSPVSPSVLIQKLRENGFRATRTHADPGGVKTDAPPAAVRSIARDLLRTMRVP